MISWLKKHFIPHEGNNHRPHILHGSNIRSILVLIIFLEIFTFLLPTLSNINTRGNMAAVLPAVLADLTNTERKDDMLQPLVVNTDLNKAAEMKAKDMATYGYFAHTSPEGKTPWYWIEQVGYKYQYAGENLAINFSDSKDITNAWMNSPEHRANLIKDKYTEIGTGTAVGIYEGKETIFVAQVYANPLTINNIVDQTQVVKIKVEKETSNVVETKEAQNVLGAETKSNDTSNKIETKQEQPSFMQKLLSSPRNTMNIVLYVIFGIILLSLLLYIFIKIRNYHPDLITNGLVTLAIIGAIFVTNNYISRHNMIILDGVDYGSEQM